MNIFADWRKSHPTLNWQHKPANSGLVAGLTGHRRVYCIGDIHGRADLLAELHEMIEKDALGFEGEKAIVYLGDYIDRGEMSRQVIDTLLSQSLTGFETIHLLGNHEQVLLQFLDFPEAVASWLSYGGRETLASYGIQTVFMPALREVRKISGQLRKALPAEHLDFFQNLRVSWRCDDYFFVHAGIRPGVSLDQQSNDDQIWIRDEFLQSHRDHGAVIVHGHTIAEEPTVLPNRIGIDTGAFYSGILTCLVLEGPKQRFLQAKQEI